MSKLALRSVVLAVVAGTGAGTALPAGPPTLTTIDVPGALDTAAVGTNARGDVVGFYDDANATHGFVLAGGAFTTVDPPGAGGVRTSRQAFSAAPVKRARRRMA